MENSRKYVLVGAVLTTVLLVIIVGWMLVSHFSYGKEWADYDELYHTDKGRLCLLMILSHHIMRSAEATMYIFRWIL